MRVPSRSGAAPKELSCLLSRCATPLDACRPGAGPCPPSLAAWLPRCVQSYGQVKVATGQQKAMSVVSGIARRSCAVTAAAAAENCAAVSSEVTAACASTRRLCVCRRRVGESNEERIGKGGLAPNLPVALAACRGAWVVSLAGAARAERVSRQVQLGCVSARSTSWKSAGAPVHRGRGGGGDGSRLHARASLL